MSRLNTFYIDPDQWSGLNIGGVCTLEGAEARHMLKVLRTPMGSRVRIIDGVGREGFFVLSGSEKNKAILEMESIQVHPAPLTRPVLALGWNKSSRRGWLLEKAVELGAGAIIFWQAEYSQGRVPGEPKKTWLEKCVAAAKQCGSVWFPELITIPGGLGRLLEFAQDFEARYLLWESQQAECLLRPEMLSSGKPFLAIGPEGGISESEADLFVSAGFQTASLGESVLRWETAALLCLSMSYWSRQTG